MEQRASTARLFLLNIYMGVSHFRFFLVLLLFLLLERVVSAVKSHQSIGPYSVRTSIRRLPTFELSDLGVQFQMTQNQSI